MSNEDLDKNLLDHNYDGIQELDNPMPSWWLVTFFGTIIFAIIYYIHFEISGLNSLDSELKKDMAHIEQLQSQAKKQKPTVDKASLAAMLNDEGALTAGAAEYQKVCAACHGDKGQGLIGPNLTDKYWMHGKGDLASLLDLVENGVVEKGMPAWGAMLKTEQLNQIVVFIKNLQGTNPANAKAGEGELIE